MRSIVNGVILNRVSEILRKSEITLTASEFQRLWIRISSLIETSELTIQDIRVVLWLQDPWQYREYQSYSKTAQHWNTSWWWLPMLLGDYTEMRLQIRRQQPIEQRRSQWQYWGERMECLGIKLWGRSGSKALQDTTLECRVTAKHSHTIQEYLVSTLSSIYGKFTFSKSSIIPSSKVCSGLPRPFVTIIDKAYVWATAKTWTVSFMARTYGAVITHHSNHNQCIVNCESSNHTIFGDKSGANAEDRKRHTKPSGNIDHRAFILTWDQDLPWKSHRSDSSNYLSMNLQRR